MSSSLSKPADIIGSADTDGEPKLLRDAVMHCRINPEHSQRIFAFVFVACPVYVGRNRVIGYAREKKKDLISEAVFDHFEKHGQVQGYENLSELRE